MGRQQGAKVIVRTWLLIVIPFIGQFLRQKIMIDVAKSGVHCIKVRECRHVIPFDTNDADAVFSAAAVESIAAYIRHIRLIFPFLTVVGIVG